MCSVPCSACDPFCGGGCHSKCPVFSVSDVTPATFETPEVHPGGLPLEDKSKAGVKAAGEGTRMVFVQLNSSAEKHFCELCLLDGLWVFSRC